MATPLEPPSGFALDEPAAGPAPPAGFKLDTPQGFAPPPGFTLDPTMGERVVSGAKAALGEVGSYLGNVSGAYGEGQSVPPEDVASPGVPVSTQVAKAAGPATDFLGGIGEGLLRGFGDRPLGKFPFYPGDKTDTRSLDLSSNPLVVMVDAALRAPGAGLTGGAALGRQIYSMLGASDTEASQLERELYQLGQAVLLKGSSGATSPVGYPKGVTRPLTSGEFLARVPGASPIVADFQLRALKEFGGYTDEILARMTPEQKQAAYQTWAEGSTVTRPQSGPQLALPPPEGGAPQTLPPEVPPEPPAGPRGTPPTTEVAAAAEALRGGQGEVSPFGFQSAPNEVPPVMSPAEFGAVPPDSATPTTFPEMLSKALTQPPYIEAYHGSPHDFEAFSIEKIGTGEGAQSYGHGLYFAEKPDVAKSYAVGRQIGGSLTVNLPGNPFSGTQIMDVAPPSMYKVRINADPEHFLDWDKPLSEQSEHVQNVLKKLGFEDEPKSFFGEQFYRRLKDQELAKGERRFGGQVEVSDMLHEAGIPGIKYLDRGSRNNRIVKFDPESKLWRVETRQGGQLTERDFKTEAEAKAFVGPETSNYVLFDDKLVEITHKNGAPLSVSEQKTAFQSIVKEQQPQPKIDWKEEAAALRQALEVIKKDTEHWGDLETLHLEGDKVVSRRQKLTAPGVEAWAQARSPTEVIDPYSFTVPQSAIDPRVPLLHDGGKVEISPLETRGIVELARERHGADFDTFVHRTSTAFSDLRDIVAGMSGFAGLKQEGIGVSFAPGYRGVSIRAPVSASFINPGLTKYRDPVRAGAGMAHTMVHELAHHVHRPEVGLEHVMSRIFSHLMAHPTFNFLDFKLRLIKILDEHQPVFHYLNGVMTSGVFPVQSSGTQFQTVGPNEARDGGRTGDDELAGQPGSGPAEGEGVSGGTAPPGGQPNRAGIPLEVSSTPHDRTNGRATNQRALNEDSLGIPAAERQPETANVLRNFDAVFQAVKGGTPGSVKTFAAHADRMNRGYKYMAGIDQLVAGNPNFTPLLRYWELDRALRSEERPIHDVSYRIGKRWRSLGAQGENLTGLLDDLANMRYRTPNEVAQDIIRQFTDAEFAALVAKNKVGGKALKLAKDIGVAFSGFLTYAEGVAIERAIEIGQNNPVALAAKIDQIKQQIAEMRKRPYFPFMRFGLHFVMKKDASGATRNFQTFERRGLMSAESQQQRVFKEAQRTKAVDEEVTFGKLPENITPFIGLPIPLLNLIKDELSLTPQQIQALEQLQLQHAPGLSFKKRMMTKEYVPGYSMDFKRAFANYFFHGARYYSRVKYASKLEEQVKAAEAVPNDNKAAMIAAYMKDHLKNVVLDAKGDHGIFKGGIFLWTLGYSGYAALQNATQLPMLIYPTLAAKFGGAGIGDARAVKALVKAMANYTNFYKKGYYQKQTEFEMRAIAYGMRTGTLSESQAAMLAGMSAQGNLFHGIAGNLLQRSMIHVNEKSAWMFEMVEQFLRRTTYMAALDLAQKYPNTAAVKTALNERKMEYETLQTINGGKFTAAQAAAIVTASLWTERANFNYDLHARPKFMQGRVKETVFVFQKYKQSLALLLGQNKSDILIRYMLMAALLGGSAAQPLYEEVKALLRFIAKHLFGKDFDLDRKTREWVVQLTNGTIPPDLILHGFARQGFGGPALLDLMGPKPSRGLGVGGTPNSANRNVPFPSFDMSRMVTTGPVLPVDVGKILAPNKDINSTIGEQTQRASGAIFSIGFNVYKALQSQDPASDIKRWEHVMPRALRDASTGYRAFSEERLRGRGSPNSAPTVIPFDPRDTEQMAEIIGMGLGLTPRRVQEKWDSIMAKVELEKYYNTRRSILLEQKFEAVEGKNQREIEAVQKDIDKYNLEIQGTPAAGKFISEDQQVQSIEGRKRAQVSKEIGIPTQLGNVGISRYIDTLFPETTVDVRRLRQ